MNLFVLDIEGAEFEVLTILHINFTQQVTYSIKTFSFRHSKWLIFDKYLFQWESCHNNSSVTDSLIYIVFKVLKVLPWDKVDIEVVMVELEHAGKVIFRF